LNLISYFIGMEVEFRITIDDYVAFYQYLFFRRKLGLRILVVAFFVCLLVVNGGTKDGRVTFTWTDLLTVVGATAVIIALGAVIPYLRTIRKTRKQLAVSGLLDPLKMILTANGLTVSSEGEAGGGAAAGAWRWESVKYVDSTDRFVFIMLVNRQVFLIPRQYFRADDEVANFIGTIRNGIARVRGTGQESDQAKARRIAPWGFLGLLPNFGAIAGLVLLYQGIIKYKSRLLIIIGLADILFTIVFWMAMRHWVFDGPVFTRLNKEMSQGMLNTVFKSVEFYKLQHGHYPDSRSPRMICIRQ
jgi:hypothetical protein